MLDMSAAVSTIPELQVSPESDERMSCCEVNAGTNLGQVGGNDGTIR
jgi:hypothetical protein